MQVGATHTLHGFIVDRTLLKEVHLLTNKVWNLYNSGTVGGIGPSNLLSNISFSSSLVDATVDLGIPFTDGLVIVQDASQSSNVVYYTS